MNRRKLLVSLSLGTALAMAAVVFAAGPTIGDQSPLTLTDVDSELALLTQGEVTSASEGCGFCIALKDTCLAATSLRGCSPIDPMCRCGFCNGRYDCQKSF